MRALFLVLSIFIFASCSSSPLDVYKKALNAAKEQNYDEFVDYFTAKSRKIFKNAKVYDKIIRKKDLSLLSDPFSLLPEFKDPDKIKVETKGNYAVISDGRKKNPKEVIFLREGGKWKIVLLELPQFWKKLK